MSKVDRAVVDWANMQASPISPIQRQNPLRHALSQADPILCRPWRELGEEGFDQIDRVPYTAPHGDGQDCGGVRPAAASAFAAGLPANTGLRFFERLISAAKTLPPDTEPRADLEIRPGNILVTRSNTPLLVGDACFVETTRPRLILSDIIYRLAVRTDAIDGRFLVAFLVLPVGRVQIESDARDTSASMVKISQKHIKNWRIPVPPLTEQRSIMVALARETRKLDQLHAATERTITLIKERRAALIAAAVYWTPGG